MNLEAGDGSLFVKNVGERAYRVAAFLNISLADVVEFNHTVV